MMEQYAWFIWSLGFLVLWFGLYLTKPSMRKQMLRVSLWYISGFCKTISEILIGQGIMYDVHS